MSELFSSPPPPRPRASSRAPARPGAASSRSLPPPRPKSSYQVQLNRPFDSLTEIEMYIKSNMKPGTKLIKSWAVEQLYCIVEVPL